MKYAFCEMKENHWKINKIRFQMAVFFSAIHICYSKAALLYCMKHSAILYYQKILLLQNDVYVFAFN